MANPVKSMTNPVSARPAGRAKTVSAGYAAAFVDFATSRGAPREELLRRAGVSDAAIAHVDSRLPLDRMVALFDAARALCADPAIALHFGEDASLYKRTVVGLIIHASSTMGEAFAQFNRYARLVVDLGFRDGNMAIERGADGVFLVARWRMEEFPDLAESSFARMAGDHWRMFKETTPFIEKVFLRRAAPVDRAEYDRVFRAPIEFGGGRDALKINDAWLSAAPPSASPLAKKIFIDRAEELAAALDGAPETSRLVIEAASGLLHGGDIKMAAIARRLGLSESTLRRRLRNDGVNFRLLMDELRREAAIRYLCAENISVAETAFLVGFSDPAAFSRAFRRWTGMSPAAIRAQR